MEKRISSKPIYDGKIIKVTLDDVELCNGELAKREVVKHNGGVAIAATVDNKIILVKQFRYAVNDFILEIPAGKIEIGEKPISTGMREIEEETGYQASKLELITKMIPTPGYCSEVIYIYNAIGLVKVENPLPMDDDEFIEIIEIDIEEAYQMVLDQEIVDAKTIIAIMWLYNRK